MGLVHIKLNKPSTQITADGKVKLVIEIQNHYDDLDGLITGQGNGEQNNKRIQFVTDATATSNFNSGLTSGYAYFEYLGTTNGDETDYRLMITEAGIGDLSNLFNKTSDDTDDITESATKKFLDSAATPQTIAGNKKFSGGVAVGSDKLTFTATPSFSYNDGNVHKMELTGNVTSLTITDQPNDSSMQIILEQAGAGSYTVAAPGASFGDGTDNRVEEADFPTTVGSKIIYNIYKDVDGEVFYSVETITV